MHRFSFSMKKVDSVLPYICSVINHRGRENVVRTSLSPHVSLFLLPTSFDVICELLPNGSLESIC